MINIKKFHKDGFLVIKDVIPNKLLKNFNQDIKDIEKELQKKTNLKNKKFKDLFSENKLRSRIYNLMQNLSSVRVISNFAENYLDKQNFFKSLQFKTKSVGNGLVISIPKEDKHLNPLHQDIYNYKSSKVVKLWIPMTKVDKFLGTMQVFKGSHKLGFIEPKYKNDKSTYPSIDKKYLNKFEAKIFNLTPSSIVVFNPFTVHQGVINLSSKVRFSITIEIQDIDFDGDEDIINKMQQIKDERSRRRQKMF